MNGLLIIKVRVRFRVRVGVRVCARNRIGLGLGIGYVSTNACIGFCQAGRIDGGRQPLSDHAVNVLLYYTDYEEFRNLFYGNLVSKTQVRLKNKAGTRFCFNLSPR